MGAWSVAATPWHLAIFGRNLVFSTRCVRMGDASDNFSFTSNDFRALGAFFCNLFRRPASAAPPISRERRPRWTPRRDSFRFGETVAAVALPASERGGLGGIPIRFRLFSRACREEKFPSLPPSRHREPHDWTAASRSRRRAFRRPRAAVRHPTAGARLGRAASAIYDIGPRAVDDSARRRHAAAGFLGEHGHGGFSQEVERRG